jgi:flagellar biosynthesis anti-sigma factor FlgM
MTKIDPRIQFPDDAQSGQVRGTSKGVSSKPASSSSGVSSGSGEDTVKLSSTHAEVSALASDLAKVPEVRVHRVQALQQRVKSGTFKPDSQRVADAIIADHSKRAPKA